MVIILQILMINEKLLHRITARKDCVKLADCLKLSRI